MARRIALLSSSLLLAAIACTPAAPPSSPPPPVMPALASDPAPPSSASPSPRVDLAAITVDGIRLGTPVAEVLAREPYAKPCDIDPIDQSRATLYFWAAGPCRKEAPFPGQTSVVIVTPRAPKGAPEGQQPIELLSWTGGSFFEGKTNLPIQIGDDAGAARGALGPPTSEEPVTDLAERGSEEPMPNVALLSWSGRVHALVRDGRVVALAVGSLEGGEERRKVLISTYGHHLRFERKAKKP
jgi:hypothetical protein